jgi:hypothetical protein
VNCSATRCCWIHRVRDHEARENDLLEDAFVEDLGRVVAPLGLESPPADVSPALDAAARMWAGLVTRTGWLTVKMLASHVVSTFSAVLPKSTP